METLQLRFWKSLGSKDWEPLIQGLGITVGFVGLSAWRQLFLPNPVTPLILQFDDNPVELPWVEAHVLVVEPAQAVEGQDVTALLVRIGGIRKPSEKRH